MKLNMVQVLRLVILNEHERAMAVVALGRLVGNHEVWAGK